MARLPTSLDDSKEVGDDDTISSLFPEVVEFFIDLGVELEDSITDMLAIAQFRSLPCGVNELASDHGGQ